MLKAHLNECERVLLATSRIPANSGHSLHKGTPRETFIKTFLQGHISERVAIGTGEIIDADSEPGDTRRQIDIVVYKRDFPKLDFGGGIIGFLAESVVATIEVKSLLDAAALDQSIHTASQVKLLRRNLGGGVQIGYVPPAILSYVVAYDGPASMGTVQGWMPAIHQRLGIVVPKLPLNGDERIKTPCPSVDGVFVLGKGFIYFDNALLTLMNESIRAERPEARWVFGDLNEGNLLLLFLFLTSAVSGVAITGFNPLPYLSRFGVASLNSSA